MKFARIVERANRQIVMTVSVLDDNTFTVNLVTHYQSLQFVDMNVGSFNTYGEAFEAMNALSDDDLLENIMNIIDMLSEGQ